MTKEEKLYMDYLENHIYNVYHSFDLIKEYLAKHLDFDEVMMKKRLNIHDASKFSEEELFHIKNIFILRLLTLNGKIRIEESHLKKHGNIII